MNWKSGNKYFKCGLTAFLVIIASIGFYYLVFHGARIREALVYFVTVLMPVIFGLIIAYLLTPILNFLEYRCLRPLFDKLKVKESAKRDSLTRGVGIIITIFLTCALVYAIIAMMVSQIVPSIKNLIADYDNIVKNMTIWLDKMLSDNPTMRDTVMNGFNKYSVEIQKWLNDTMIQKSSQLLKTVSMSIIGILKVLWNLVIGLVISVYVLANKEKFCGQYKKIVYALFKENTANIIINNFHFTHRTFIGFVSGKVLDSIIIGCFCFMGTTLLGTPFAPLVSVVIGVTNIIPFFGPYLGAIPSALLILLIDPMHPLNMVYFLIFILLLQQFDGNILGPKILGNSTGLTGFWVLFAITLFGGLWGILGMIIGVPLFAVIYAALKSFVNCSLKGKNLPRETSKYIRLCCIDENGMHEFLPEHMRPKDHVKKHKFGDKFLSPMDETIKGKEMRGEETIIIQNADNKEADKEGSKDDKKNNPQKNSSKK